MPRRVVVLFGLVAFAGLCLGPLLSGFYGEWLSGFSGIPGIEGELTAEATQELDEYGLDGFAVSASGRDLTVTSPGAVSETAKSGVRSIDGVGSVTFVSTGDESGDSVSVVTDSATDSATDSDSSAGADTDPDTEVVPTEVASEPGGQINFSFDESGATVSGEVQTDAGHEAVSRAARRLVGEDNVAEEIRVAGGSGSDLDQVSTAAAVIRRLGEWYVAADLSLDDDQLVVSGIAKTSDDAVRAQQVVAQLSERVAMTATVDSTFLTGDATELETDDAPDPDAGAPDAGDPATDGVAAVVDGLDLSGVTFEPGTAALTPAAELVLDDIAARLNEVSSVSIQVQGHTDNQGDPDVNLLLSDDRARSVQDYLVEKGVEPNRLTARGFGASQPIADNSTSEGQAANRRVELVVTQGDN